MITTRRMLVIASKITKLPYDEIIGPSRKRIYMRPRWAVTLCARAEGLSTAQIGKAMGGRDHTTIITQVRQASEWLKRDHEFKWLHAELLRQIADEKAQPFVPQFVTIPAKSLTPTQRAEYRLQSAIEAAHRDVGQGCGRVM